MFLGLRAACPVRDTLWPTFELMVPFDMADMPDLWDWTSSRSLLFDLSFSTLLKKSFASFSILCISRSSLGRLLNPPSSYEATDATSSKPNFYDAPPAYASSSFFSMAAPKSLILLPIISN